MRASKKSPLERPGVFGSPTFAARDDKRAVSPSAADAGKPKKRRFPVRTEEALKNLALSYVARFPCTTEKLRKHLAKKMRDALDAGEAQPGDGRKWIDGVIETLTRVKLLDDKAYAEARAMTLHRRGRATSIIVRDLAQRGAPETAILQARDALAETSENPDLTAAARLARKKRLGPFSKVPLTQDLRRKQLATLARSGFSFDIARQIVDAKDPELLSDLEARSRA